MTQPKKEFEIFNSGDGYSITLNNFKVSDKDGEHLVYRFDFKFPKQNISNLWVMGYKKNDVFFVMGVNPHQRFLEGIPFGRPMDKRTELPVFVKLFPHIIDYLKKEGFKHIEGITHEKMARLLTKRFGFNTQKFREDWKLTKQLEQPKKFLFRKTHLK